MKKLIGTYCVQFLLNVCADISETKFSPGENMNMEKLLTFFQNVN